MSSHISVAATWSSSRSRDLPSILHFYNPASGSPIAWHIGSGNMHVTTWRSHSGGHPASSRGKPSSRSCAIPADRLAGMQGALGVFGLDSKAACFLRIRRLLDDERSIRIAPGAGRSRCSFWSPLFALPHLRPARSETDSPRQSDAATAKPEPRKRPTSTCASSGPTENLFPRGASARAHEPRAF